MTQPGSSFTDRLRRRQRDWWGRRGGLHRLRERKARRTRHDPDDAWRCCAVWQRTLLDKWNVREFAARFGCPLPELYWAGTAPPDAVLGSLPDRYVVRPFRGHSRRGVLVVADGRELLRDEPLSPQDLRERLPRARWGRPVPILIEELLGAADGELRLPVEYKCHVFGGYVGAFEVMHRIGLGQPTTDRFFTPDWGPFHDPMNVAVPAGPAIAEPPFLQEMRAHAERMGAALGTYMRIDFFATDRGLVFNEFSSMPWRGEGWTPFCDSYFGALWDEHVAQGT